MAQSILGDYQAFFVALLGNLQEAGICVKNLPLSHLCIRAATNAEYETKREQLKRLSRAFVENEFNGRPLSMFLLRTPLVMSDAAESQTSSASHPPGSTVELIELPAPKASHTYPSGLEHAGFVVGPDLTRFNTKHEGVLSGVKDRGAACQPSFLTFSDGRTAKFYDQPLLEIVQAQGWRFDSEQ
jgi:predicted metalloenzyme YecM